MWLCITVLTLHANCDCRKMILIANSIIVSEHVFFTLMIIELTNRVTTHRVLRYTWAGRLAVTSTNVHCSNTTAPPPVSVWTRLEVSAVDVVQDSGRWEDSVSTSTSVSRRRDSVSLQVLCDILYWEVPDDSVVKVGISGTCNVLSMIWRSWVQTPVGLNLGCMVLLPKLYLN